MTLAPLEDSLEEGEVHVEEESEEDVPDLKHARDIASPSADQVESHRVTHLPYRSWCKHCIMGRGVGRPHSTSTKESSAPIVGMDYFYITKEGVRRRSELAKELAEVMERHGAPASAELRVGHEIAERAAEAATTTNPAGLDPVGDDVVDAISAARTAGTVVKCLLVRCLTSKNVFAHVVPQKGDDEDHYCAKLAVADIEWLGHTKVIIKTDNERSIVALKQRVAKTLREWKSMDNVQTESPAAYESQSNGGIEVGIKIVRGLFRTLKLCLEARIGKYVSASHAIVPWLLQHTCTLLNAKSRGSDGLTCWERVKGRMFNQLLLGFAETVLYKLPSKGPRANPDGNMGTKWLEGLFLGFSRSSNSYMIGTEDGVVAARSIYRRPAANRWSVDRVTSLTATPWSVRDKADVTVRFQDAPTEEERRSKRIEDVPKAFRINHGDLVKHGFTEGCPQCDYNTVHKKSKAGISHTNACRKRMLEALMDTPQGRARLEAYEEKVDQAIADRIEASDRSEAPQPRPVLEDREAEPRRSFIPEPEASAPPAVHRGASTVAPGTPAEPDSVGYPGPGHDLKNRRGERRG